MYEQIGHFITGKLLVSDRFNVGLKQTLIDIQKHYTPLSYNNTICFPSDCTVLWLIKDTAGANHKSEEQNIKKGRC